jgi:hypothetical protein
VCFLQAMAGMLMVGVDSTHARWLTKNSAPMNESEAKVQFGGECILSSPLILSFDPTNATGKKEKRLLFFEPSVCKMHHFTKTGSGQT